MNLLLTGAFRYTAQHKETLENLGYSIIFAEHENAPVDPEIAKDIEAVVCNALFLHNDISLFPSLRFIQLTSAGLDRVPLETIRERRIELNNAAGVYNIPMAEWAVFKALEYYKRADHFRHAQQKHQWLKDRNIRELRGGTAAVIGCGGVGTEVARLFNAFGMEILGADIRQVGDPAFRQVYTMSEVGTVLGRSDVIVLTLPLTEETRHFFNREMFSRVKPGAILINISRGAVINEQDLAEALIAGTLAYAALDVFEREPLEADSPLWDMDNVSVTPHNSFVSDRNPERLFDLIYKNLSDFIDE